VLTDGKLAKVLATLDANWQAEIEGHWTYQTLAERDSDPVRAQVLHHLAGAEWEHAALWAGRIRELDGPEPLYQGSNHGDADSIANRAGGIQMALRRLEIDESRDIAKYGEQLKALGDSGSIAILNHVIEDEKDHYEELGSLLRGHYVSAGSPKLDVKAALKDLLSKSDQSRKRPGAWIGDAIYGVNDGLGAIFGIVSGVSGATAGDSKYVLLAGLSGMIASALSMGSGAYLAAKSEREIYFAEVAREREAIQMNGPKARELLSLYYQVKACQRMMLNTWSTTSPAIPISCCVLWPTNPLGRQRKRFPTRWFRPPPVLSPRPLGPAFQSSPSSLCMGLKRSSPRQSSR
jgi:vacuolar iron transporter family protein